MERDIFDPKYLYTLFLICSVIMAIVSVAAVFENWSKIASFFRRLFKKSKKHRIRRISSRRSLSYDLQYTLRQPRQAP